MLVETNEALVQRWVEQVWNAGELERLAEFHPATFENHGQLSSIAEARQWHTRNRITFPDIRYTIDDIFACGPNVALRWTATATHAGALWEMIPATGKSIRWSGMHMLRVVDGQIVAVWAVTDTIAQLQQMGVTLQPVGVASGADA